MFRAVLIILALASGLSAEGRKVAFLVGVGYYKHLGEDDQLGKPPVNDVTEMKKVLEAAGYTVVALTDAEATKDAVESNFNRILKGQFKPNDPVNTLGLNDQLIFLFSGHGLESEAVDSTDPNLEKKHQPFFMVHDSRLGDAGKTMVAVNGLIRKADDHKVRMLFFVDACRNNLDLNRGLKEKSGIFKSDVQLSERVSIFYSCASSEKSLQNDQLQHGLFTYALLRRLRGESGPGGVLTWNRLVDDVQEDFATGEVSKKLGTKKQTPVSPQGQTARTVLLTVASNAKVPPPNVPVPKPAENVTEETFDWKGETRTRKVLTLTLGGEKVEFVQVPAGNFQMGSPGEDTAYDDEKPQHKVTFTKPVWVGKYHVTKGQFAGFVKAANYESEPERDQQGGHGYNAADEKLEGRNLKYTWKNTGWTQSDKHPVVNVTWNDAKTYCDWAEKQSGKAIRLPSEAEYEYANRGGATTRYFTGDDPDSLKGYANVIDQSLKGRKFAEGWTLFNFNDGEMFTSRVGSYKPNGFGLYDMTGNAWCWCEDRYDAKLYARGDVTNPGVNQNGEQTFRVLRGACWDNFPVSARAACRSWNAPVNRNLNVGFRLVLALD